jgi:two-component system sensor histidine kinase BarA
MKKIPILMVVEDDRLTLKVYEKLLSPHFEMVVCSSVEEYLNNLPLNKVDMFIVDISLKSDVDGVQLIRGLREMDIYKNTPVIVITAHAFMRDERKAMDAGATAFLRKPIDNKYLLESLARYVN